MRLRSMAVAFGLALASTSGRSQAAVIINVIASGSDVVATGSGFLNIGGLSFSGNSTGSAAIRGADAFYYTGQMLGDRDAEYTGLTGPANLGSGTLMNATTYTGDVFGFNAIRNGLFLSTSFRSGNSLNFTTAFSNQTLASLGLDPGTYTYTLPNDSFTLKIGTPSVVTTPLPASAPMFGAALVAVAGIGYAARRKNGAAARL